MWSSIKSVKLSLICTRCVIVLVVACAVGLPKMMDRYLEYAGIYSNMMQADPLMVILYVCCIPAMVALICLDRLLANIKREEIFTDKNVKLLRIISWCCFAVSIIFACAGKYYLLFIAAAIAAAFIGLILRVVKNVIERAKEIKSENDFTI